MSLLEEIEVTGNNRQKALVLLGWWLTEVRCFWRELLEYMRLRHDSRPVFSIVDNRVLLVDGRDHNRSDQWSEAKLRLSEGEYLVRRTSFPREAQHLLHQAVEQYARSVCPFDSSDMVFGWGVDEHKNSEKEIDVTVVLLSKDKVQEVIDEGRLYKLEVTHLQCRAHGRLVEVGLLELRQIGLRFMRSSGLRIGCAVLTLLASGLLLERQRVLQQTDVLSSFIDENRDELTTNRQALRELETLRSVIGAHSARASRVSAAQVLTDLSERLPDHTHLTAFQLTGTEIDLNGASGNAADLVPLLEASTYVETATFDSEIRASGNPDKQGFRLKLTRADK